jgi:hypothetical protein
MAICRTCGKEIWGQEAEPHIDPYDEEMNGGTELIIQCRDCDYESAMDI